MTQFNMLPVNIQQMIEELRDKKTPEHVKFNRAQMLDAIQEQCQTAVNVYRKKR